MTRVRASLPAVLALVILAIQIWIPFSAPHFATQDGSSYVYSAVVARDLVFHPHSEYSAVYEFRKAVVPNWGALVLLNVILPFVGVELAEKVLMSLCFVIGFLCLSYFARSIDPELSPWTPLTNFLLQNWLLWTGFYNFYLGTLVGLLLVGYYIRRPGRMTMRLGIVLSTGLVGVFLIHLMGAAVAILGLMAIAVWRWTLEDRPHRTADWRQVGLVAATLIPTAIFTVSFALSSSKTILNRTTPVEALLEFPLGMFTTGGGLTGKQIFIWPIVLAYIVIAIATMRAKDWRTVRGGVALAAIASFVGYLIIPDGGFGGGQAKVRFAWALFIFGGLLAVSTRRLIAFRLPVALYVAGFLFANLISTVHSLRAYSAAITDYLSALDDFPRGARIIRIRYRTPDVTARYGFLGLFRDPLLRVDGYAAALCHCIDLTEYQAPNFIFPVVLKANIDRDQQDALWWNLEAPGKKTEETFRWVLDGPLGSVDYVIVVVDRFSPPVSAGYYPALLAALNESEMQLTPRSRSAQFVRVYARVRDR